MKGHSSCNKLVKQSVISELLALMDTSYTFHTQKNNLQLVGETTTWSMLASDQQPVAL